MKLIEKHIAPDGTVTETYLKEDGSTDQRVIAPKKPKLKEDK